MTYFSYRKKRNRKKENSISGFFSFSEYFSFLQRKCYFLHFLMVEELSVLLHRFCLGGIAFC